MTASLPYAGSSGWSGSEASRERAEDRDSTGKTALLQSQVVESVRVRGSHGMTIAELREDFRMHHHGSLSGALTVLHKAGRLARLAEKRNRCSIYVYPGYEAGRLTVAAKRQPKVAHVKITSSMDAEFIGHLVIAALNEKDRAVVEYLGDD
jgi:hypothetical protein